MICDQHRCFRQLTSLINGYIVANLLNLACHSSNIWLINLREKWKLNLNWAKELLFESNSPDSTYDDIRIPIHTFITNSSSIDIGSACRTKSNSVFFISLYALIFIHHCRWIYTFLFRPTGSYFSLGSPVFYSAVFYNSDRHDCRKRTGNHGLVSTNVQNPESSSASAKIYII